jgi:hypothetical protein
LISRLGAAEDLLDRARDQRRARLAADQQHLVDLVGTQAGLASASRQGPLGALDQRADQLLEAGRG